MIFILMFVENCLQYDAIHDFTVWPRTGSSSADINQIRSHTGLSIVYSNLSIVCKLFANKGK